MISTEEFVQHDTCPRSQTYTSRYEPLRVSLNYALNESLYTALSVGNPIAASDKLMELAARPGIEVESRSLYDSAIHHSRLVELLASYVLAVGPLLVPDLITCEWGEFQPRSFLTEDGRLRRVVLCDRWTPERELLERFSWRTAIDSAITNRPMIITALVIGRVQNGFRPSVWTQGFEHPMTREIRIQKREGKFTENWRSHYRENTQIKALEWLRIMQEDGAFEGRVFSATQNPDPSVLPQVAATAREMGSMRQTRSSCYRFKPCPFLPACSQSKSPAELGWIEKNSLVNKGHAILAPTI